MINFNFPKNTEWMLSHLQNEYFGPDSKKKEKDLYDFDMWHTEDPAKSIARYRTKTAKQMAKKIKILVKRLKKSKLK